MQKLQSPYRASRKMNFSKKELLINNKRLVILLVGWRGKIWNYFFPILALLFHGFDCIAYEYSPDVLSPDIKETISRFNEITEDIQKTTALYAKKNKYEEVYLKSYESPKDARQSLTDYVSFYNRERLHQSLEYKTPEEIYFAR